MMQNAVLVDLGIGFNLSGFLRMVPILKSAGNCQAELGDGLSICLDRSTVDGLLSDLLCPSILICFVL